jgi:hypothetical protein
LVAVIAAQFAFTYVPFMQALFKTEPIALLDGALIVGIGVALLLVVEIEKRLAAALRPKKALRRGVSLPEPVDSE